MVCTADVKAQENTDFCSRIGKLYAVTGKLKAFSVFCKLDMICKDQVKLWFCFFT